MRRAHAFLSSDDLSLLETPATARSFRWGIRLESPSGPGMSEGEPVSYGVMTRTAGNPGAAHHDEAARPLPFSVACL